MTQLFKAIAAAIEESRNNPGSTPRVMLPLFPDTVPDALDCIAGYAAMHREVCDHEAIIIDIDGKLHNAIDAWGWDADRYDGEHDWRIAIVVAPITVGGAA